MILVIIRFGSFSLKRSGTPEAQRRELERIRTPAAQRREQERIPKVELERSGMMVRAHRAHSSFPIHASFMGLLLLVWRPSSQ